MSKRIELTQGQVAIVDDADFDWLNQWKWCARWNKGTQSFYAVRNSPSPEHATVLMHRQIIGLVKGDHRQVDHRDHDTLNCCRQNLRVCTSQQNIRHQRRHRDNASGFKGVYFYKPTSKWAAMIKAGAKNKYLGYFPTAQSAALAYDAAAQRHFGEFAVLNFPKEAQQWLST